MRILERFFRAWRPKGRPPSGAWTAMGVAVRLALLVLLAGTPDQAASAEQTRRDPPTLVGWPGADAWVGRGRGVDLAFVAEPGVKGNTALRARVPAGLAHPWDAGAHVSTDRPIRKGDAVAMTFWARADRPARIFARLQGDVAPYVAMTEADLQLTSDWRLYRLSGIAPSDFPAGKAGAELQLGKQEAEVMLGPIFITAAPPFPPAQDQDLSAMTPLAAAEDFVVSSADGVRLAATLHKPIGEGRFPTVLLYPGKGNYSRADGSFRALTQMLVRLGVAVVDYDKRGSGASAGSLESASLRDLIADAAAVKTAAAARRDVDAHRLVVLGASEGAIIAPAVAAEDPNVKLVVLIAPPALRQDRALLTQIALDADARGASAAEKARGLALNRALFDAVVTAPGDAEALARATRALEPAVADKRLTAEQARFVASSVASPQSRAYLSYDPAENLRRLTAPTLVIAGALDLQVPPRDNLPVLREAMKTNRDLSVVELAQRNHVLQTARTGLVSEWGELEQPAYADREALDRIGDWLATHLKLRRSARIDGDAR